MAAKHLDARPRREDVGRQQVSGCKKDLDQETKTSSDLASDRKIHRVQGDLQTLGKHQLQRIGFFLRAYLDVCFETGV